MKNLVRVLKIVIGAAVILMVAYSLSFFNGTMGLLLGGTLMLAGITAAVRTNRLSGLHIAAFCIFSAAATLALRFLPHLPWHYLQYFFGGATVYFACSFIFPEVQVKTVEC